MNVAHYEEVLGKAPTRHLLLNALKLAKINQSPHLDAEDFAQELFLGVWERRDEYDPDISTWVTWANTLINQTAMAKRREVNFEKNKPRLPLAAAQDMEDPEAVTENGLNKRIDLIDFLRKLDPIKRQLFPEYLALSNVAILARKTGLKQQTLRRRLREIKEMAQMIG